MTQRDLADAAEVGLNTIAAIEAARDPAKTAPSPQLDTIEKIAEALGCSTAELLDEESAYSGLWSNPGWLNQTERLMPVEPVALAAP